MLVLSTVITNRMTVNKSTYECFIDSQKAFDMIKRDLLAYRLTEYGMNGKFYRALKSLYSKPILCVRLSITQTGSQNLIRGETR